MGGWFLEKLKDALVWIGQLFTDLGKSIIDAMLTGFTAVSPDATAVMPYINAANYYVPIDFALGLLASYLVFWGLFVAIKFTLKLIPGIG